MNKPKVLAGIGEKKSNNGTQWYQQDRIYDNNVAISVTTSFNPWYFVGGNMSNLRMKEDKTFIEKHYDNFKNKNGYIPEMFNPYNESEIKEVAPTQSTCCGSTTSSATVLKHEGLRIRKLTPKECWRLMGFTDEEFNRAAEVNSNTQLYKQAGNSIVVDVLVKIFTNLFSTNDYTIDKFIEEEELVYERS